MPNSAIVFFADSLPLIVFIADARGELEFVNKQWLTYSGMGFQESLKAWYNALDPSQLESFKTQNKHILKEGLIFETEYRILNSDGLFEWAYIQNYPDEG